jgi:Domain of unknown function (DUF3471)
MPDRSSIPAIVAAVFLCVPSQGQWLNYKTPGIPRTADGKPNLSAPTPRLANGKPDFSGLWRTDNSGSAELGKAMEAIKPQTWAVAVAKKLKEELFKDSPGVLCLPPGPMVDLGVGKVVQTPNLLVMLFEGALYREVFLDGRELPKEPNPDWMGYSVGRWEGDTLVVESNGFNDRTWLDGEGHPHTEALHVTERLRRPDFGHLEVLKTLADPGALMEPWTVPLKFEFDADTEAIEYVCNENERDHQHLIGKASDQKGVEVDKTILSKYVGTYEFSPPDRPDLRMSLEVALDGDRLAMAVGGPKQPLVSLSATEFATDDGAQIEFFQDDKGAVTHLIAHIVEGDLKAVRKK